MEAIAKRAAAHRTALVPVLMGVLAACATGDRSRAASGGTHDEHVPVEVTNHNWSTITVYALLDGVTRVRIGTVETLETARLRLPPISPATRVQLFIHSIGGSGDYLSPEIAWPSGGIVRFSIENQLTLSSYVVDANE